MVLARESGLPEFDRWVVEQSWAALQRLRADAGLAGVELRGRWRFDAIMQFRRKLSSHTLDLRAALGLALNAALSSVSALNHTAPVGEKSDQPLRRDLGPRVPALVGRFDELSGALDVVDLTNPTYVCRVTLVEADGPARPPSAPADAGE